MDNQDIIELRKEVEGQSLESFKKLRTSILYTDDLHVIALTSTIPDEGKTITAFNLAKSFAEMGKKVVLIDCDLRRSSMKNYLMIKSRDAGLSEALTGQTEDYVHETNFPNLSIVLAGKRPPNPTEIISSSKFKLILEELSEQFDYVFIDTPPVTVAADAIVVSREVDGCVMVVRNEFASKKAVRRSQIELESNGARIVGVVLNGVKRNQVDYDSYSYYGYY
ncbi:MAG: CpsD/CapB family tyrosine-protein kinase [Erysipelotrichaceae bacterium]|nr:CpsD/CapB family tyrosine-protein kinase [Erysipelotrichaceae bacterium]